ncbi:MAG: N-acetylmannosamine-6-phosphate 2-epimerase [Ignavibacteriaceae bacterium]|nr:N-acetylmannosamine-6-phosphate 2-epimerase [Ignavibacteriaceae bacterium]
MMDDLFYKIKNGLIVSCQAEGDDPFNSPEGVTLFARAAKLGGACAIRSEGIEKTKMIVSEVGLPAIGLIKSKFEDGYVRITGSFDDVENLIETGANLIAIDGTFRKRQGWSGPEFIREVKKRYNCLVMADVATYSEGIACAEAGADCISTTLSGYTPETKGNPKQEPDFELVEKLSSRIKIPVIAEGKINKTDYAKLMIEHGAWAVVVGTAITRPRVITSWFVDVIKKESR